MYLPMGYEVLNLGYKNHLVNAV